MISFPAWGGIWEERPQAATAPPSRTFVLEGRLQVDVQDKAVCGADLGEPEGFGSPLAHLTKSWIRPTGWVHDFVSGLSVESLALAGH